METLIEWAVKAGPFGAIGASIIAFVLWKQLLKAWAENRKLAAASVKALNAVNSSLTAIKKAVEKPPTRRRRGK